MENHSRGVNALTISPDQKYVYSGDDGNAIIKSDFRTGSVVEKITDVHTSRWCIAIAPNGEFLVRGGDDSMKMLNAECGNPRGDPKPV